MEFVKVRCRYKTIGKSCTHRLNFNYLGNAMKRKASREMERGMEFSDS